MFTVYTSISLVEIMKKGPGTIVALEADILKAMNECEDGVGEEREELMEGLKKEHLRCLFV